MSRLSAADFEVELQDRDIPTSLGGLKITSWTIPELQKVVKQVGGEVKSGKSKMELCQQLYDLKSNGWEQKNFRQRDWKTIREIARAKGAKRAYVQPVRQARALIQTSTRRRAQAPTRTRQYLDDETEDDEEGQEHEAVREGSRRRLNHLRSISRAMDSDDDEEDVLSSHYDDYNWLSGPRNQINFYDHQTGMRRRSSVQMEAQQAPAIAVTSARRPTNLYANVEPAPQIVRQYPAFAAPNATFLQHFQPARTLLGLQIPTARPYTIFTAPSTSLASTECQVCFADMDSHHMPGRQVTSSCAHPVNSICRTCIAQSITAQKDSKGWAHVTCPFLDCNQLLAYADFREFAAAETFSQYDSHITVRALSSTEGYVSCSKPTCKDGGFVDAGAEYFTCDSCNTSTCITCKTEFHAGISHSANQCNMAEGRGDSRRAAEMRQQERASVRYIQTLNTKPCPNCRVDVQKISGCDHMACGGCQHQFCWDCLRDYDPIRLNGNHYHALNCKWYRVQGGFEHPIGQGGPGLAPAPRQRYYRANDSDDEDEDMVD